MAGKLSAGMAWVFALLTIAVSFLLMKLGLGGMVGLIVTSAVFLAFAFLGGFATKAGAGHVIAAMIVAIVGYVGVMFFMIGSQVASAAGAMAGAAKAAGAVQAAGGDVGAAANLAAAAAAASVKSSGAGIMDLIINGWKPLAGAFAASVIGAIIGNKMKSGQK